MEVNDEKSGTEGVCGLGGGGRGGSGGLGRSVAWEDGECRIDDGVEVEQAI